MTAIYRLLLRFYPREFQSLFGTEMLSVFQDAQRDHSQNSLEQRFAFHLRETFGLLAGAVRERPLSPRWFAGCELTFGGTMNCESRWRFPNSMIVMMTVVFLIVVVMIAKIQGVSHYLKTLGTGDHVSNTVRSWPAQYGLVSGIAVCFVIAWAAGVIAWAIAHATRRSGAQRFDQFQTWPQAER